MGNGDYTGTDEAFVEEVRRQGVLIVDPNIKRLYKMRNRLGLQSGEAKDCTTIRDVGVGSRGIAHYMGQQQFGLYIVQGCGIGVDVIAALETIGLESNGNVPMVLMIGNNLEGQVGESVEVLRELGTDVKVAFVNSGNGYIDNTTLRDILRKFD
ncbi:hypothetical protein KY331_05280 [Candidatus Woesearchaeota archaeon]|nr:hypothetical protein [Candidatus Woesearchaeota archaeon]